MNTKQTRAAFYAAAPREQRRQPFQVREAGDGNGLSFSGYASVTDTPYKVTDWLGDYTETITRGAFAKSLAERDDVRLLVNHDGIPIARTKSGTLTLDEDDHGLRAEADLDGSSPLVQSVRSAMARGDLDQMSFAFQATRQEWNEDYTQRTIREVKMFDVSVVTYPASDSTSAYLRATDLDAVMRTLRDGKPLSPEEFALLERAFAVEQQPVEQQPDQPDQGGHLPPGNTLTRLTDVEPEVDVVDLSRRLAQLKAIAATL